MKKPAKKSGKNNADRKALEALIGSKVVSYHALFAKTFGSVTAAVFLSQGYFWQFTAEYITYTLKDGRPFFDKTIREWYDATGLTEDQQRGAREVLKKAGVLMEIRLGNPARMNYSFGMDPLVAAIVSYLDTGLPVRQLPGSKMRLNLRDRDGHFLPLVAAKDSLPSSGKTPLLEAAKHRSSSSGKTPLLEAANCRDYSKESIESNRECERDNTTPPTPTISNPDPVTQNLPDLKAEKPVSDFVAARPLAQEVPGTDPAAVPLRYDQYPLPNSGLELKNALRAYFMANPREWTDGVLEQGKAGSWTGEKLADTLTMFCAHQESKGALKLTYGQYKGLLVKWFLSEKRFEPQGDNYNKTPAPVSGRVTVTTR